jgi:uncharacterized repeat protein (TIGR01451 family)
MSQRCRMTRGGSLGRRAALAALVMASNARAQEPPPAAPAPAPARSEAPPALPATILAPDVQVVRFSGPVGVIVEVLGPQPEPVPVGDGRGLATVGLRVGVAYQLRVSNLPGRPNAMLFPMIELVGHLHRPPGIDPAKYPIRVPIGPDDIEDVIAHGRLVTKVVYLEDPELALPLSLPKDEIPEASLSAVEDPLKVAPALGRVVAVLRIGGRAPTPEDLTGAAIIPLVAGRCPFTVPEAGACSLPCGPVCGTPPPPGRPWLPRDEFLCDGGDHAEPVHFGGDGGLRGVDPRDAVIRFHDDRRPRVLPTNRVCIYAPRFAAVRASVGPNEATKVDILKEYDQLQQQVTHEARQNPRRMTQNQAPELNRGRLRPSGLTSRIAASHHIEVRVLAEADAILHPAGNRLVQGPETKANRQKAMLDRGTAFLQGTKTAEGLVVTGIVEGAGQQVMAWKPQELAAVEVPPNKPGLAVVKQVSSAEAEPGDVITYTITYRNMGNVPITSVSIVDSLLPRLEYVKGSAKGPAGAVFTAGENRVGATELRWDIGTVPPGVQGAVAFDAKVR